MSALPPENAARPETLVFPAGYDGPYVAANAEAVQIPSEVYLALLRLAAGHKRALCTCENCPPGKEFPYDNCECGEDWSTCSDDVAVVDVYSPDWRGWP
jgi:hypothetical protein